MGRRAPSHIVCAVLQYSVGFLLALLYKCPTCYRCLHLSQVLLQNSNSAIENKTKKKKISKVMRLLYPSACMCSVSSFQASSS